MGSYIRKFEIRKAKQGKYETIWEGIGTCEWTDYRGLMRDPFLRKTKEAAEEAATETGSYQLVELERSEPLIEGKEETCLNFIEIRHEWEVS